MILSSFRNGFGLCLCALVVTACSGGAGDVSNPSTTPTDPPSGTVYPQYRTNTGVPISVSTQLEGTALQSRGGTQRLSQVSGTVNSADGSVTISDGSATLSDPDGFDASGTLSNGAGATYQTRTDPELSGYDYVTVGKLDYLAGGTSSTSSLVVIGVDTENADMPSRGIARYTGSMRADEIQGSSFQHYQSNQVVLDVDFGSHDATLTAENFGVTSGGMNFDALTVSGIDITGNNLSGGTATTLSNGSPVTLYGSDATTSLSGTFYGFDTSIGAPDEAGGVFLVDGSNGQLMGYFVVD